MRFFFYDCYQESFSILVPIDTELSHSIVADDNEVPEVTLVQTIKTFSKRPIEQLDIIKEIDVLVSLSGKKKTSTK